VAAGSSPTPVRRTSDPAPRTAAPLILRGPDHFGQALVHGSATAVNQAAQPNSLIVRGTRDGSQWQSSSRPATPTTETLQARSTAPRPDTSARPLATQRSQTFQTAEAQGHVQQRAYTPRGAEPTVRSERAREFAATGYSAPVQVPRSAPAPSPTPQVTRSYSPPTPTFTPRPQVTESRPVYTAPSTPSAPAASSSGGHSQSSSGKGWR
jgi:hypothetical protein